MHPFVENLAANISFTVHLASKTWNEDPDDEKFRKKKLLEWGQNLVAKHSHVTDSVGSLSTGKFGQKLEVSWNFIVIRKVN